MSWQQPDPGDRLLVLAPHPDDECLAVGGILARAAERAAAVRVLFATDGDNAVWIQRAFEKRWSIGAEDRRRFGRLRRSEAEAAARALGLDADALGFLGFPDQGFTPALLAGGEAVVARLAAEIRAFEPTCLLVPSVHDIHPDHSALAVLVQLALDRVQGSIRAPEVLSFLVHRRTTSRSRNGRSFVWLDERERERKRNAIRCYASQTSVHAKKFLGFAGPHEELVPMAADLAHATSHPIQSMQLERGRLSIAVRSRFHLGAFGRSTLLLTAGVCGAPLTTWSIEMAGDSGSCDVRDVRTGSVVDQANIERSRGGLVLDLPIGFLPERARWFAKIERRHGFFDEAGWLEIPRPARHFPDIEPMNAERVRRGVVAVVPCYDVVSLCGPVLHATLGFADVVLGVDDGSTDGTGAVMDEIAAASSGRMKVLRFEKNRGKGVGLMHAFRAALDMTDIGLVVTLDGDGQHEPKDIPRLVRAWEAGADFVVGQRASAKSMPLRSRIGNQLTTLILRMLSRRCPRDTQSGFRALDRTFVEDIVCGIEGARYETELKILLLAIAQRREIASVEIPTVYIEGNRSSHFRPLVDSLRIYRTLLRDGLPAFVAEHRRR